MALLKAFVCQVVLFGLYKLFLEQVVEDHLVPDELTRNCLVGVVCLFCFGIQIYTENADDECDEDPKVKSKSRESTSSKKFVSGETTVVQEIATDAVGSNLSSQITEKKRQTSWQDTSTERKQNGVDSMKGNSSISSTETENYCKASHNDIFTEFTTNVPDRFEIVTHKDGMKDLDITSTVEETKTIPETNVYGESDEDGIEIDHCISPQSLEVIQPLQENAEIESKFVNESLLECKTTNDVYISSNQLVSEEPLNQEAQLLKTNEDKIIEVENISESECLASNEVNISSNESQQLESKESLEDVQPFPAVPEEIEPRQETESATTSDEPIIEEVQKLETEDEVPEAQHITESITECVTSNSLNVSSTKDLTSTVKTDTMEPPQITNCEVEEPTYINGTMEGNESDKHKQELTVLESSEYIKDITELLPSAAQKDCSNCTSTNEVIKLETENEETSTVSSPRETISDGVYITPVSIDISFIYACH